MDSARAFAVSVKDLREVFSSIEIFGPMIFIPLFFSIALPLFTSYITKYAGPQFASRILGISGVTTYGHTGLAFLSFFSTNVLGPVFLTMPIITASVIAADSFAGEKERKTAEALLSSPITNSELLIGKMASSFIPSIALTAAVFAIYAGITDYISMRSFGVLLFPNESWWLMLLNAPFLALTTIGLVVIVSSRARGVKESQQISTLLILPILVIPFASIFNISRLSAGFFIGMLSVLIISAAAVVTLGVRLFERERFITA